MSGFNLQGHLVKSQTRIPVIFITGHDRYRMEDEAMGLGAIAYLRKPFDEQYLLDAIHALREGKGGGPL
jgi:FixJ family two-component response regulator